MPETEPQLFKTEPSQARTGYRDVTFVATALALLAVILVFGLFSAISNRSHLSDVDLFPLLGTASLVILSGMAVLYFHAFRVYRDGFYALLGIGWVGNALYLVLESFYMRSEEVDLRTSLYVYIFALVTIIPFYLASFKKPDQELPYSRAFVRIGLWYIGIALTLFVGLWLVHRFTPFHTAQKAFMFATFGGIVFASWTLVRVGRSLRDYMRDHLKLLLVYTTVSCSTVTILRRKGKRETNQNSKE